MVIIDNWEAIVETAVLFSKSGRPKAEGVMASSGGAAVMAADKAEEIGLALPPPAAATSARLANVVPDFGSTANPCDLTAESLKSMQMYGDCIRAFAEDPGFAAVVVPMMSAYRPTTIERAQFLSGLADELDKPVCLVWINEWINGPGSEVYDASPRISMFRSMTRCIKALKLWTDHYRNRDRLLQEPALAAEGDAKTAREVFAGAAASGHGPALSESQSKRVLAAYGVRVTREILVANPASAVKAAVERAASELLNTAAALPGTPILNGILVQQMAERGVEMMIGALRDAQFGQLVVCGFGGVDVELTRDVAVALAPVNHSQARDMILSLRKAPLLTGFRNMPALDVDALAEAVCRVAALAADLRDAVSEIDVNPLILGRKGGVAVEALVIGNREDQP